MQRKGSLFGPPPIVQRPVFGSSPGVALTAGEAELDVIARHLSNDAREVCSNVVSSILVPMPKAVPLLTVRIDVGHHPPLVMLQQRVSGGQVGKMTDQVPQESGSHRLVGMAAAYEAHPLQAVAETERPNGTALSGLPDLLPVVA
jgi:hypothetical protein